MKQVIRFAALVGLLPGAAAKVLRWEDDSPSWSPAQSTAGGIPLNLGFTMPQPTAAPDPANVELKLAKRIRNDNTCAYISGVETDSLYCSPGSCVFNSFISVMGCCTEASVSNCKLATTCIPSSNGRLFTTNNGYSYFCGSSVYPECVTYVYSNADRDFAGYTIFGCGRTEDRVLVLANPVTSTTSTTTTPSTTPTPTPRTTTPTTTPTPPPTPPPPPSPGSSTPTGAIVGGVVGGVGAIALIGLGLFFILRRKKQQQQQQQPDTQPPQAPPAFQGSPPPAAMYEQPQQMQQMPPPAGQPSPPGYPSGFMAVDNRSSMLKSPYDVSTNSYDGSVASPPASPPPQSPQPSYPSGAPLVQNAAQFQSPTTSPTQYQYPQHTGNTYPTPHGYQQAHMSELPTGRGDNELRELA